MILTGSLCERAGLNPPYLPPPAYGRGGPAFPSISSLDSSAFPCIHTATTCRQTGGLDGHHYSVRTRSSTDVPLSAGCLLFFKTKVPARFTAHQMGDASVSVDQGHIHAHRVRCPQSPSDLGVRMIHAPHGGRFVSSDSGMQLTAATGAVIRQVLIQQATAPVQEGAAQVIDLGDTVKGSARTPTSDGFQPVPGSANPD